jgi:DNA-binding MarR family transcriptional regulator
MNEQKRTERIERFAELSEQISMQMHVQMAHEWPEHELSMAQFKALVYLAGGAKRMGDLSRFLGISLSSTSNLADRLEGKGLINRDHDRDDRRVVSCELTGEGHSTVSRFWLIGRQRIEHLTGNLSDEEVDLVNRALELLAKSWERSADTSPGSDTPDETT